MSFINDVRTRPRHQKESISDKVEILPATSTSDAPENMLRFGMWIPRLKRKRLESSEYVLAQLIKYRIVDELKLRQCGRVELVAVKGDLFSQYVLKLVALPSTPFSMNPDETLPFDVEVQLAFVPTKRQLFRYTELRATIENVATYTDEHGNTGPLEGYISIVR